MQEIKRWNGRTKTTEELTFTLHYADGTEEQVKDGVLFTINDENTMDIHVGVNKVWQLFGIYICFMNFLEKNGLLDLFDKYIEQKARKLAGVEDAETETE